MTEQQKLSDSLEALKTCYQAISKLRDPERGCPWDKEQTHQSLTKYLVEETYEFIDAVNGEDDKQMMNELGDVLLQVFLHSVIAKQRNAFTIADVAKILEDKIIRRHPHVFAGKNVADAAEVEKNWQEIKQSEKANKKAENYFSDDLMKMPPLLCSHKIGKLSEKINFDWENRYQVTYKVEEEWQELKEELAPEKYNFNRVEEELGDFLFTIVQLARHLQIDPEQALSKANKKFLKRFKTVEDLAKKDGLEINNMSTKDLDGYWSEAKRLSKGE